MRDWENVSRELNVFGGMIYNACRMSIWCFALDGYFFCTTSPCENEFRMLLEHNGCLEYALSPERHRDRPVYLSDSIGLIWAADYVWDNDGPMLLILLGPVFSSESSIKGIEDSLRRMDFSIQMRNNFIQKLKTVPVMNSTILEQYTAMLHHIISGEMSAVHDYEYQASFTDTGRNAQTRTGAYGAEIAHGDAGAYEAGISSQEATGEAGCGSDSDSMGLEFGRMLEECIMQAIREGNINFNINEITVNGGHQTTASFIEIDHCNLAEVHRDEKNTVIIFVALCARAAMEGGLSPRMAKDMQVAYIQKVENAKTLTDLMTINMTMLTDFIHKVHESKAHPDISRPIQNCCDYIQKNLMTPFELSDMARAVGYTEYYLTKKFHKELGIHLTDYIKNARIEMAKIWLMTTDKSIQEISDQMCFNTRGYFSKVFKEKVGVTPAAYRSMSDFGKR